MKKITSIGLLVFFLVLSSFGVSYSAYKFTYTSTVTNSQVAGVNSGEVVTIEVISDNGANTLVSQQWFGDDVLSAKVTAGIYEAEISPPFSFNHFPNFETDETGALSNVLFNDDQYDPPSIDTLSGTENIRLAINAITTSLGTNIYWAEPWNQLTTSWTITETVGEDGDGDGVPDNQDNCVDIANSDQLDSDLDGLGDVCDNCPDIANTDQTDSDSNGTGDACENAGSLMKLTIADPKGDHTGNTDILSIEMIIDKSTGDYDIFYNADVANPFTGSFRVNVSLRNLTLLSDLPLSSNFSDTLNDFSLSTPTTQIQISGYSAALVEWNIGDEIAYILPGAGGFATSGVPGDDLGPSFPGSPMLTSFITDASDAVVDTDGDSVPDDQDNCPDVANADQLDSDMNGIGDACEAISGPMYFYFSGHVNYVDDKAGAIAAAGLSPGDPVFYAFLVDVSADGTFSYYDDTTYPRTDTSITDYFYSDYIEGSALEPVNGGFSQEIGVMAEQNYGKQEETPYGAIYGNSFNDSIQINAQIKTSEWVVGDTLMEVRNSAFDPDGNVSALRGRVKIIGISSSRLDDFDGDGLLNTNDNCPADSNADQVDTDNDGYGDACDLPANPMYYTFEGNATINCTPEGVCDEAGAIAAAGIADGDPVTYTVLLDLNSSAGLTSNAGIESAFLDELSNSDLFFADYIGGAAIEPVDGGFLNSAGSTAEWNWGSVAYGVFQGQIRLLSDNNFIRINSSNALPATDWQVGDAFNSLNQANDSAGLLSKLYSYNLTLTDISAVPPASVDFDGDGIPDDLDLCPDVSDPDQLDSDFDGVGDMCDNCPDMANADQSDTDGDDIGDVCDVPSGSVFYTFQGTVGTISDANNIVDGLVAIGDPVEFTFEVRFDEIGTQIRYNGQLIERSDYSDDSGDADHFWTDYLGGTDIGPIGEITTPNPNYMEEFNYGLSFSRKENGVIAQHTGYLYGSSTYNWVIIENYAQHVQEWVENQGTFRFRHRVRNQGDQWAQISGTMHLTSMSGTPPTVDDTDGDGVPDVEDNCPSVINADQADADSDGIGNVCDNCPDEANFDQQDGDGDGVGDSCDNCPDADNQDQVDADNDGIGDACDTVLDYSLIRQVVSGGGISDASEPGSYALKSSVGQSTPVSESLTAPSPDNTRILPGFWNTIGKSITAAHIDADKDGIYGNEDVCPGVPDPDQLDSDGDGVGDACDTCPGLVSSDRSDTDLDGHGNACDDDDDNDGIHDEIDTVPSISSLDFSDVILGGTTSGNITERGDQVLAITEAANPEGVNIRADISGGLIPATLDLCGGISEITVDAEDEVIATCGSVTLQVISGSVDIKLLSDDGTVSLVTLNSGNGLTFDAASAEVSVPPTNTEEINVSVNGEEVPIVPDETVTISDGDQDGYISLNDCDDNNPSINPGADEICDGFDNDCDGEVNEDRVCNAPPVAVDDAVLTNEDTSVVVNVLDNDFDFNGDSINFVSASAPSNGSAVTHADGTITYTPAPDYFGSDSFGYTISDDHGARDSGTVSVTVDPVNDPPKISVDITSQTIQYSDAMQVVTITVSDIDSSDLTISTSLLPDGVTLNPNSCMGDPPINCQSVINGIVSAGAGTYDIIISTDDSDLTAITATRIVVEREDATVTFADNDTSIMVEEPGEESDDFSLSFSIRETTPDQAVAGAHPGDTSNAGASIKLVPVGFGAPVSGECNTPNTSSSGYDNVSSWTCEFEDVPANIYTVQVVVEGNYYLGSGKDVLTVYDPSLGFTTGGGYFFWPGTDDKTNFAYTIKYSKKDTRKHNRKDDEKNDRKKSKKHDKKDDEKSDRKESKKHADKDTEEYKEKNGRVHGSLLLIRHLADGTKYRIKSNTMYDLSIGNSGEFRWASFSGTGAYFEPGMIEPSGNHEFIAYVEDGDKPGAGEDRFWFEVKDEKGAVIPELSMDRNGSDNAIEISGGNIVVPH